MLRVYTGASSRTRSDGMDAVDIRGVPRRLDGGEKLRLDAFRFQRRFTIHSDHRVSGRPVGVAGFHYPQQG